MEYKELLKTQTQLFKNQVKDENIVQLQELSSQIKLLAKTISLIKK